MRILAPALPIGTDQVLLIFPGDLKLEGPVSGQVKMLLEENAALQVSSLLLCAVTYPVVPEKQWASDQSAAE